MFLNSGVRGNSATTITFINTLFTGYCNTKHFSKKIKVKSVNHMNTLSL